MGREAWGPLIPTQDGKYIQLYTDGSVTIYDQQFNVVSDDASPNPQREALVRAGRSDDAARDAARDAISNENARRYDVSNQNIVRQNELRSREIENTYKVNMMNARTAQDVARANEQLARDRLQFDREVQAQNLGIQQAGLGARMVETAAGLTGPAKVFEAFDLNRGYGAMQDTPVFLQSLRDNTRLRDFGAQGGAPAPLTMDSLMAKLTPGYADSAEARTTQNALGTISDIGARGAHRIGAGQLESLNPSEQAAFLSGLGKAGFDRDAFLADWRKSRIGQGIGAGYRAA